MLLVYSCLQLNEIKLRRPCAILHPDISVICFYFGGKVYRPEWKQGAHIDELLHVRLIREMMKCLFGAEGLSLYVRRLVER